MQRILQCGRYDLPLAEDGSRPLVMGILNVTPDSFSDGGRFNLLESALGHAEQMMSDGVDIIDIGAESTRPGVRALPVEEELRRLLPVLYALRDCGKPLSVDTRNPLVMREALMAGADMINDVNGFRSAQAVDAVAEADCGLCIMHMQNDPENMQLAPHYDDVIAEVSGFLQQAVDRLSTAGVARARICVDPGFGFGKNLEHNLQLFKNLRAMKEALGLPMLVGVSRKSMIGQVTGRPVAERMAGSLAAALMAADRGADIIRVHDVAGTVDALKIRHALT
ncbi:dihydropteroate synthase [Noviherbaspirillum suwonense]|uniref:Dihydropteroate synthase n=1 Tax=Noviherbaspirillum suwonense TaxID=1224511 RepID=A0ABY1PTM3_9BURK|nr:dihydropteroate synthase [Noviherbaspirillum suwonense]SMP46238.1 dihydropteroate synthase [Noviherbaspirillum suwonense]